MKVTIKKLLSLIVIPAAVIYSNFILCTNVDMSLWIIISTVVVDLSLLMVCMFIFNQHKDYIFSINFEYVPLCCIGIGMEKGSIGIILPFCVFAFGWIDPFNSPFHKHHEDIDYED